ncbi:hypothetical protein ACTHSL_02365 [Neisseria sp. P0008.S010]|uniref:hypothetical protein n=1 Tax=Neisseria sp. P0008.S010 TaxID=3436707 RepID=UPI003F81EA34
MPLQTAEPLQTAAKDKTSVSKHKLFGRNFKQATGKAAVCPQADIAQGKTPLLQAAAVRNFHRNKQKAV